MFIDKTRLLKVKGFTFETEKNSIGEIKKVIKNNGHTINNFRDFIIKATIKEVNNRNGIYQEFYEKDIKDIVYKLKKPLTKLLELKDFNGIKTQEYRNSLKRMLNQRIDVYLNLVNDLDTEKFMNLYNNKKDRIKVTSFIDEKGNFDSNKIKDIFNYIIRRYLVIYNNINTTNDNNEFKLDSEKNITEFKEFVNKIFNNPFFDYCIEKFEEEKYNIQKVLYDYLIKPNMIKNDPNIKKYYIINDIFKKFNRKYYNSYRRDGIKNHIHKLLNKEAIYDFVMADINNKRFNSISNKIDENINNKNISDYKLMRNAVDEFLTSFQICISFAEHTIRQFLDKDDISYSQDVYMSSFNNKKLKDNLYLQKKYILNLKNEDNIDNTLFNKVKDLRNDIFHCKYTFDNDKFNFGKIKELFDVTNIDVLDIFKKDIESYDIRLLDRYNTQHIYMLRINNKKIDLNIFKKYEETTLLKNSEIDIDYTIPQFKKTKIIDYIVDKYLNINSEQEIEYNSVYYYFKLLYYYYFNDKTDKISYNEFTNNNVVTKFKEYMNQHKDSKYKNSNDLFTNVLKEYKTLNVEKSLTHFKKYVQSIINENLLIYNINKDKNTKDKALNNAQKLSKQFQEFENILFREKFINDYLKVNVNSIDFNYESTEEANTKSNNFSYTYNRKIYLLSKYLDVKHISMLINNYYRFYTKIVNLNSIDVINNEFKNGLITILKNLCIVRDIKDLYVVNGSDDNKYVQDDIIKVIESSFMDKSLLLVNENDNNKEYKKLFNIMKINLYGFKYNGIVDNSVDDSKDSIENTLMKKYDVLNTLNNELINQYNKTDYNNKIANLKKDIHKLSMEKYYKMGNSIILSHNILIAIQHRLLRTMYMIEKDIKKMFISYKERTEPYSKEINNLIYGAEFYIFCKALCINIGDNTKIDSLEKDKEKDLIRYLHKEHKNELDFIKSVIIKDNTYLNINTFFEMRNAIDHFSWINGLSPEYVENLNIGCLFRTALTSNDTDSIIEIVYKMLKYDLKKQKTFIESIKNIFKKEKIILDIKKKDEIITCDILSEEISFGKNISVKYHIDETIKYVKESILEYKVNKIIVTT